MAKANDPSLPRERVQAEVFKRFGQYGDRPETAQPIDIEFSGRSGILRLDFAHVLQEQENPERPQMILLMSRRGLVDLAVEILDMFHPDWKDEVLKEHFDEHRAE